MTGVILKDLEVNTALSSILKALESQQPFHKEKQSAQVCILGNNSNISGGWRVWNPNHHLAKGTDLGKGSSSGEGEAVWD